MKIDNIYKALLQNILEHGFHKMDASRGISKKELPQYTLAYDMTNGFPLLTSKKMAVKGIASELCFFLKGKTNIDWLHKHNNHIWDKDAYAFYRRNGGTLDYDSYISKIGKIGMEGDMEFLYGELGPVYGSQWRNYNGDGIDQIANLFQGLEKTPFSNRHIVTAWNPSALPKMALPPCHDSFIVSVYEEEIGNGLKFALTWNQRSVDTFLGLPFNIASYTMLGKFIEAVTGYRFAQLYGCLKNVHIYANHYNAVEEQLQRDEHYPPSLFMSERVMAICKSDASMSDKGLKTIELLEPSDFIIDGYIHSGSLKGDMLAPLY